MTDNPNKKIDIYILSETWLNERNKDKINFPNYSYVGNHRMNKKGGGVGILVHNGVLYQLIPYISELELLFFEVRTRQGLLIIGSLHRPPQQKKSSY